MPKGKEFTVTIEDKPGALGRCFLSLAERGVNILAFQSYVEEGESLTRFLVDDVAGARAVLGGLSMIFEETEVVIVRVAHRPGELGRAASRLGAGNQHRLLLLRTGAGFDAGDRGLRGGQRDPRRKPARRAGRRIGLIRRSHLSCTTSLPGSCRKTPSIWMNLVAVVGIEPTTSAL